MPESFIRLPNRPPPPGAERSALRAMFSTPLNAAVSLALLWLTWAILLPAAQWVFWDATYQGADGAACGSGMCWPFVSAKLSQWVYGRYPDALRWRVDLALTLLAAGIAWLVTPNLRGKKIAAALMIFAYPLAAFFLLYGGLGLEIVETSLWGGVTLTLVVAVIGDVVSLPLALFLALGRRARGMPVLRAMSSCFIEFVRGVPLITMLFMASVMLPLFLPEGANFDKLLRALIAVTLFQAAYLAEVIRGGLQTLPPGQEEAARAMGLGYWRATALVTAPQALKVSIPGIVNSFIALLKDTTLVLIIGLFDVLGMVQLSAQDSKWISPSTTTTGYAMAAFFFWCCCFALSRYSQHLERKLATGHSAGQ